MKIPLCLPALLLGLLMPPSARAATFFYAQPYRDRTGNPFWQGVLDGTMYLEDFEDRQLNTPYVTGFGGATYQTKSTPNVDGDDGRVDGRGQGFTWNSFALGAGRENIRFDFSPNADGLLPKYAGAVLFGFVSAEVGLDLYQPILVYDATGNEITGGKWQVQVPKLVDGVSERMADRFAAIYNEHGISRIVFPGTHVVDHLTYGYAIPEPSSGALLLGALGAALNRRRRGRA
ncbi:MAG: PEP-CTERM sorting domain-containing protein [Verrucomicrobiota bacterium]